MTFNQTFNSQTYGKVNVDQLISYCKAFLEEDPNSEYGIIIGTDSQEHFFEAEKQKQVTLISAIVLHRKGWGGKYFWQQKRYSNIKTLRDKLYAETYASLELAMHFVPKLKSELSNTKALYSLEIHIDVGEHGKSREVIKEVAGIISGNGFVVKTKPFAFAASYVADKHT